MKRIAIAAAALCLGAGLVTAAEGDRCKVTDPTGTPLNVRAKPNGKITGTLANGTLVSIIEAANDDKGQPWVRVKDYKSKQPIGWVFREFVSCY